MDKEGECSGMSDGIENMHKCQDAKKALIDIKEAMLPPVKDTIIKTVGDNIDDLDDHEHGPFKDCGGMQEEEIPEQVDHPDHYNQGKIEVIDFIESQEHLGFGRLTALKYICRSGKKYSTSRVQDLQKAIWYLEREIAKDEV